MVHWCSWPDGRHCNNYDVSSMTEVHSETIVVYVCVDFAHEGGSKNVDKVMPRLVLPR